MIILRVFRSRLVDEALSVRNTGDLRRKKCFLLCLITLRLEVWPI